MRRSFMMAILAVALGLLLSGAVWAQGEGQGKGEGRGGTRIYVVKRGDSCWSIAQQVFGKGEAYRIIHRHNDLGPMPHILTPGQHLRLPGKGTGPDARVAWLRHKVLAKTPTTVDWLRAKKDMGLWRLYKVSTGDGSSAGIHFVDRSSLRMREKALLVIYGGSRRRTRVEQQPTTVVLEKGTVRGGLARLDREAGGGLKLRTPSASITLRSRSSQVEVDQNQSSIVSVYQGDARVAAAGGKVKVPADHGTHVVKGKKPAPPRRLPRPPRWGRTGELVVLVPSGFSGSVEARWRPVKGAARYRVELARDRRFTVPIVDATVGAGILRFSARQLAPGRYFARVAARDRRGLEGRPSTLLPIQVARLRSSRVLKQAAGARFEAVGLLRLQPDPKLASRVQLSVDGGPFVPGTRPARLSRPGLHRIRVRAVGGQAVTTLVVQLLGVVGKLTLPTRPLASDASTTISLQIEDERGRPAALPAVRLRAFPGGLLKLTPAGAGRLEASLSAPKQGYAGGQLTLVADWAAGELGRARVTYQAPPAKPAPRLAVLPLPPEYTWHDGPAALAGRLPGPALPARQVLPQTRLGLSASASGGIAPGGDDPVMLRMALHGELALLSGKLGLEAEMPWFQTDLTEDSVARSNLGDLRLGARYVVLHSSGVALAPSLRLTAPTGGWPRDRQRSVLVEPSVALQWSWRRRLTLATHQALVLDAGPEQDTGLYHNAAYSLTFRFWRLSLAGELDSLIGQDPAGSTVTALAAGGGLWLHLDRLRLGLTGGGGLTEDGRRVLGRFFAGLRAEIGFSGPR